MSKMDWDRVHREDRVLRHGSEPAWVDAPEQHQPDRGVRGEKDHKFGWRTCKECGKPTRGKHELCTACRSQRTWLRSDRRKRYRMHKTKAKRDRLNPKSPEGDRRCLSCGRPAQEGMSLCRGCAKRGGGRRRNRRGGS